MGISSIAYNAGAMAFNTAKAIAKSPVTVPTAIAKAAWNNPKTAIATTAALGALAYAAYTNQEALGQIAEDYAPSLKEHFDQGTTFLSNLLHDTANYFGFADVRTQAHETCVDKGWIFSNITCETTHVPVNMFYDA